LRGFSVRVSLFEVQLEKIRIEKSSKMEMDLKFIKEFDLGSDKIGFTIS
jgi:hypothetical protein